MKYRRKCGDILAKKFRQFSSFDFLENLLQEVSEKSSTTSTSQETKVFHRETLGAGVGASFLRLATL